jgi:uncharacterized membrane protein YhaH (DUF805 family)
MDWDWGHLLTGFNGRINRARYWGGAIAFGVGAVILQFLLMWIVGFRITMIIALLFLYPAYALLVKRGNDRDRPAVIAQAFIGVAALSNIIQAVVGPSVMVDPPLLVSAFNLLLGVFALYILVDYGCLRGTVGPNRYGPDPLEGKV